MAVTGPVGLQELRVRGFRSARRTTVRPGRVTILVGEANAGKSNLLAAARAVLDPGCGLSPADATVGGDGRIVLEADLVGRGRARLLLEPDGRLVAERDGTPPVLFLPSELRAGAVLAEPVPSGGEFESLKQAIAEQAQPPRHSRAAPATGLVKGLDRCADLGLTGAVVLVEEPELYLRPQAQRYLARQLRCLADAGNQVLFSTHSPAFLNVSRLEELVLVGNDRVEGTTVFQPGPLPAGDDFRTMSEFDAERGELFLARVAVLVEGRTEKLALPHVFRALGHDPDRAAISIVECGGKGNIPVLARVCRACGVPVLAVHDRDAASGRRPSPTEQAAHKLIAEIVGPDNVVELAPDFEGVSGLRKDRHKPEQAWRHFRSLRADQIPEPLRAVVHRTLELARG
ncbi:MAG: ATP-dependent nuclease [Acidimicrobiia bacterium]